MGEVKETEIIRPAHSSLFLDAQDELARLPLMAHRKRSKAFYDQFEDKALFYDCFWHHDGADVLLVGPPPLNLLEHYQQARFVARPSGEALAAEFFRSRSTMTTRLANVAPDTTHIQMIFAGDVYDIAVQPSLVNALARARILFTMNKDNDLAWINDWAKYHVHHHKTDTIVLFDNGSARYGLDELAENLGRVAGLKNLVLFSWPYRFGRTDNRVFSYHYWAHFLQISSMGLVLRRLGMKAEGILNCDIDELVAPVVDGDVFHLAQTAPFGVASLSGKWVEAVAPPDRLGHTRALVFRHGNFTYLRRDPSKFLCPKKWACDPKQDWLQDLNVFPYWHRIMGAPERKITEKPRGAFWHFRGINTNWKEPRTRVGGTVRPNRVLHYHDEELAASLARLAQLVPKT